MDRSYFADYEIWSEGMPVSWGNTTLSCLQTGDDFDPAQLLALIRERVARERVASPQEIRVRNLTRL